MTAPKKPINKKKLDALRLEAQRRLKAPNVVSALLDSAFPKQREFIDDTSQLKVGFCTRRAGKTTGCTLLMLAKAVTKPGSKSIYVNITRGGAKDTVWKELKALCIKHSLPTKHPNETDLSIEFDNGSFIKLYGGDSTVDAKQKLRGQFYDLCVIDEIQDFRHEVEDLVNNVLEPAIAEREGGCIVLIGTANDYTDGYFYKVTTGSIPGWSVHRWSWSDNPYTRDTILEYIAKRCQSAIAFKRSSGYRQEWLGEWVVNSANLLYWGFNRDSNCIDSLPCDLSGFRTLVSIDPGYTDAAAIVVMGWRANDTTLYILETFKKSGMDITAMVEKIRQVASRYENPRLIVDAGSPQGVAEMRNRHRLPLESASKTGIKWEFIQQLNSDFQSGAIKFVGPACYPLADELEKLVRGKDRNGNLLYERDRKTPDDLSDAMLYGWREAMAYVQKPKKEPPPRDDTEAGALRWWEDYMKNMGNGDSFLSRLNRGRR